MTNNGRRPYDDPRWKKMRKLVLERDGYRCQLQCSPKCKGDATEVDHIVSVSDGGAWLDPANLVAACKSCNISKRNSEVAARARGVRAGTHPSLRHEKPPLPDWPTQAEYLAATGYDWPVPSRGWRPE